MTNPAPLEPVDRRSAAAESARSHAWFVRTLGLGALLLFLYAYAPSARIPFRIEQWDYYHFFATYPFDSTRLRDWLLMAFWTPFGDFRFLPLAYLWNFAAFSILGPGNFGLWTLALGLNVLNSLLLARWVSALRGYKGLDHGLVAAALFLLLPARHEVVIWTFFSYKLAHTALVLGALVLIEAYVADRRRGPLAGAVALLFLSWMFYETSLPVALVIPVRLALSGQAFSCREKRWVLTSLLVPCLAYGALRLAAHLHVPAAFGLDNHIPWLAVSAWTFVESLWKWVLEGAVLGNSGLPIIPLYTAFHLGFRTVADGAAAFFVPLTWGVLLSQLRWRPFPLKEVAYLACVAAAASILLLVGRTLTNGSELLARVSMYQHVPTLFLAATLGYVVDRSLEARRFAAPTLLLLVALLAVGSRQAVGSYMRAQAPLFEALARVERVVRERPDAKIYAGDVQLPFVPTWGISNAEHSYHAFRLLYGDRIVREKPGRQ